MRSRNGLTRAIVFTLSLSMCGGAWAGCRPPRQGSTGTEGTGGARAPSPPRSPERVTCRFSAESQDVLSKALSEKTSRFSPEVRVHLMSILVEECRGWPPVIDKTFALAKAARGLAPDPPASEGGDALLEAEREDMNRRLEGWCPGYAALLADGGEGVSGAPGTLGLAPGVWRKLWKVCQMDRENMLTETELVKDRPVSLLVYAIFQSLRAGGMEAPSARLLARQWLPYDPIGELAASLKIAFPKGSSGVAPLDVPRIAISATQILLSGQPMATVIGDRSQAEDKRDGEDGFLLSELYRMLSQIATRRDAVARQGGSKGGGWLTLMADATTRFSLVTEVLYTAAQARFKRFQMMIESPDSRAASIVFEVVTVDEAEARMGYTDRVILRPNEIELKLGPKVVSQRIPLPTTGRERAFEVLTSRLHSYLSSAIQGERARSSRQVGHSFSVTPAPVLWVEPTAEVTLQDIAYALMAVRAVARGERATSRPGGVHQRGCPLEPNPEESDFVIAPKDVAAWAYPLPRLSFLRLLAASDEQRGDERQEKGR